MKYDEMDKLEVSSYPNEYVVKESGRKKSRGKQIGYSRGMNASLFVCSVAAGTACATLLSTVISLAVNGQLATVFQSLLQ